MTRARDAAGRYRRLLAIAAVAVAYYVTARACLLLAVPHTNASAVWVPAGIAVASMLLMGRWVWPGIAIGAFAANLHGFFQTETVVRASLFVASGLMTAGNVLEALLARYLIRRYINDRARLEASRDPLVLVSVGAACCLVAAGIGNLATRVTGIAPWETFGGSLVTWWLGDLAAVLVVVPLFVAAVDREAWRTTPGSVLFRVGFLLAMAMVAGVLFAGGLQRQWSASLAYLILPLVLLGAIWFGLAQTHLAVAICAAIAVYGAIRGEGPFVGPSKNATLLLTQGFVCILAVVGNVLAGAVAELRLREQNLTLSHRALRMLTQCNAAVVQAEEEEQLLREVCRIAVDDAGYQLAWVGYAMNDEARTVKPMVFAGPGEGFIDRIHVSWADNDHGHGTLGPAIRTGEPSVAHDIAHHPNYAVWREVLREREFKSVAAVPLKVRGTTYGAMAFYADEPHAFAASEVLLLSELGRNLAYGILAIRTRKELDQHAADLEQRVRERTAQLQQEIGQREQAEQSLRRSEQKYRELVENANSIILRWDTEGRITFANEFTQRFFGFSEDELVGRNVLETIVPPTETGGRDLAKLMHDISHSPEGYTSNENENVRRDRSRVWIAWTNRPIFDAQGHVYECLSVGNDITAIKEAERALLRAKQAAEAADRIKSAFLATMSHELRTPLNSIIGFTGILLQGLPGALNAEQQKQLGMVQASARHLLALINDVLDISKIEAGQLDISSEPFDLRPVIEKAVQTVRPMAQKKALPLACEIDPRIASFTGDARRVEQILLNLLSNAVKFTEQGYVDLRCTSEEEAVCFEVSDTGIGIAPEHLGTIFEPFRQVDSGTTRKHEGTGLGLSISQRLVQRMGGTIAVQSQPERGSVFTVRLPKAKAGS